MRNDEHFLAPSAAAGIRPTPLLSSVSVFEAILYFLQAL
jgi:hypothetical protein